MEQTKQRATDMVIINTNQRKKAVLGKVFNVQHELFDLVFRDSYDNKFNNFINLYERSVNWTDSQNVLFEVKSDFRENIYLQWNHGPKSETGFNSGMRFPGYISYIKEPTKGESHKLIDIDIKNLVNFVEPKMLEEYSAIVKHIEDANLNSKLLPGKEVFDLNTIVERIAGLISDEYSKYSWVGGVFWGGKGFSYWGDWSAELMKNMATAGLVDPVTNATETGYFAQRLSSLQLYKPTLVTNYYCVGDFNAFKYCCPGFFMLKGNDLDILLDKYYRFNFVSTYKATIPFEKQLKWQDEGTFDIKMWDAWREELKKIEDEIKTIMFTAEK